MGSARLASLANIISELLLSGSWPQILSLVGSGFSVYGTEVPVKIFTYQIDVETRERAENARIWSAAGTPGKMQNDSFLSF